MLPTHYGRLLSRGYPLKAAVTGLLESVLALLFTSACANMKDLHRPD